jgi:hypothetical protein
MIARRPRASGYTFLEVTLALGLSLILVAGIYSAVQMTYQQWEIGRQAADEAQLVRSLFQRIRLDMQSAMTSWKPPTTVQPGAAAAASAATGATGASAAAATGSSTGGTVASDNPTDFPPGGVFGGPSGVSVVIHSPPSDLDFSPNIRPGTTISVLRTISYRIGSVDNDDDVDAGLEGLIRDESPTTPDANTPNGISSDAKSDLIAPEVEGLRLSYYDGLYWTDSWDSEQTGPPVCVQVEVGLRLKTMRNLDSDGLRWYKATIYFPPAGEVPEAAAAAASAAGGSATGAGGASTGGAATGGAGS